MKIIIYTLIALVMMACGRESSSKKKPASYVKNLESVSGKVAGHDYVDLGLPSGTKWATCNVGGSKPTEYGDYFAWGETTPKNKYKWRTYKWCTSNIWGEYGKFTKYVASSEYGSIDNKKVLEAEDDAATVNWGCLWRTPTIDEIIELKYGCTWEWVEDFNGSGVNGQWGTSKTNGNTIFMPAAGSRAGSKLEYDNNWGFYLSSSLAETHSGLTSYLCFDKKYIEHNWTSFRYLGRNVRAVVK